MAAVGIGGKANDLGQNRRATADGALTLLHNQRRGPFADDETVTILVEGTRAGVRTIVAGRCCIERVEDRSLGDVELVRTACQHDVGIATGDGFVGIADGQTAGGAGGRCGDDAPGDAKEHADVDGGRMAHHLQVAGGIQVLCRALFHELAEGDDRGEAAKGGAIGDAAAPALEDGIVKHLRVW